MTEKEGTANESAPPQKRSLPLECLQRLQKFDEALTALEMALAPFLQVGFEEHMKRSALDMARVDVMTMFVLNSLGWCLTAQRGMDPKDDVQLADELRRTKQYVTRLKWIEKRKSAPGLNKQVAKAFVRNALYELPGKRSRVEAAEEAASTQAEDSDVSDVEGNGEDDEEMEGVMPEPDEQESYTVTHIKFGDEGVPQRTQRVITGRKK